MANGRGKHGKRRRRTRRGALNLSDLPEDCIANVISRLTSPKDACRLSLVATWLRPEAESDQVWEKILPDDYREILGRSAKGTELLQSSICRKQLYLHLCDNPLLIDGENKSFWIDKSTGKKCFLLGARALQITQVPQATNQGFITIRKLSRFGSAFNLFGPSYWILFRCRINTGIVSPDTRYGIYLVFYTVGGGRDLLFEVLSVSMGKGWRLYSRDKCKLIRREGEWWEVELGEVIITGEKDVDLMIQLLETNGGWNRSLIIEGIEIRVKH